MLETPSQPVSECPTIRLTLFVLDPSYHKDTKNNRIYSVIYDTPSANPWKLEMGKAKADPPGITD